jgi:hypothetical protein
MKGPQAKIILLLALISMAHGAWFDLPKEKYSLMTPNPTVVAGNGAFHFSINDEYLTLNLRTDVNLDYELDIYRYPVTGDWWSNESLPKEIITDYD